MRGRAAGDEHEQHRGKHEPQCGEAVHHVLPAGAIDEELQRGFREDRTEHAQGDRRAPGVDQVRLRGFDAGVYIL